uniref:Uncharacterized protein n=1 Tax=Anopheles maculatus TaxID=74869 RepID=A0A182SXK3_9DIPT
MHVLMCPATHHRALRSRSGSSGCMVQCTHRHIARSDTSADGIVRPGHGRDIWLQDVRSPYEQGMLPSPVGSIPPWRQLESKLAAAWFSAQPTAGVEWDFWEIVAEN